MVELSALSSSIRYAMSKSLSICNSNFNSVGFPDNQKAPVLEGGQGYTVEQSTEVEAKWFWLVPAAFLGAGIGAAAIINK